MKHLHLQNELKHMNSPILFLDIDGVLNGKNYTNLFGEKCVKQLNRILKKTKCKIVISSAWRYMVLEGVITAAGFEHMMITHGIECKDAIAGFTRKDSSEHCYDNRLLQIKDWVKNNKVKNYVIVDDIDNHFQSCVNFVKTNGDVGLTRVEADKIIALLAPAKLNQSHLRPKLKNVRP